MNEQAVQDFWNKHPCDDQAVGGMSSYGGDYVSFFDAVDAFRYKQERHILACLDAIDWRGKKVLEIGLGQGSDSEQLIRRGAIWTGLDLTPESVARVKTRMRVRGLPFDSVVCGSALEMPFADGTFDYVYSHGVLHHIPNIEIAQSEIARVLKPKGRAIVMLYARWSLNYLLSICVLRRLGLLAMYALGVKGSGIYGAHLERLRRDGLSYLGMDKFLHAQTDGPGNPFSRVYDVSRVRQHFSAFRVVKSFKRFMWAPPLPVLGLPGGSLMGWHLWVYLEKRSNSP